ncbi:MAG: HAD-IIB family hydrolase [Magnetococcales bacterium]|nr:HAD-IIB family hydrolase [Magnetococcales bacterium]
MKKNILMTTDLDRTLIGNGRHPEDPQARPRFDRIVARPEVALAYVSGRDFDMIQEAIKEFSLPRPDYLVTDVGAALWTWERGDWQRHAGWDATIAPGWQGWSGAEIAGRLQGFEEIQLQEPERQGRFKLSYYWFGRDLPSDLNDRIVHTLRTSGLRVEVIISRDEMTGDGFLDVLPQGASKLGAVRYLVQLGGFLPNRVIFAGDSGNDLDVLVSSIPAVLVRNAPDAVRHQAIRQSRENGTNIFLYLAKGDYGMNGCYAAGILEGLAHFIPETREWIRS